MARWSLLKNVLVTTVNNWRLWVLQFAGNVVIFLGFVWWLRLPDAHWWQLLFGLLLILLTAGAALVLHGATMNYFQTAYQGGSRSLVPAFRSAGKHVPAVLVWTIVFFCLWRMIGGLHEYDFRLPGYLRSGFPAWLRRIVSEPAVQNGYSFLVWFLRWVLLPGLLLPLAMLSATKGFRGLINFREWRGVPRSLAYWLILTVAAILGVYCVDRILHWTMDPKTATLQAEKVSLGLRLLLAYLVGLFSWLLTCSVLGRRVTRSGGQPAVQPE